MIVARKVHGGLLQGVGQALYEELSVGASPAVQNAVLDALAPYGITHLDMPLTSMKIWEALRSVPGR